ncbi:hypothetical protein V2J09_010688 [Rumex salicifolius]
MTSSISTTISLPPRCRHFSLSPSLSLRPSLKQPSQFHLATSILVLRIGSSRKPRRRTSGVLVRANSIDFSPSALKPPGRAVETDKLPSDVRRRAMDAVDSSGGRVTIGDVASKAGLKLDEAQRALQALATDTDGFLEVSNEGDVLYVFPREYRSKLSAKSIRMKLEPLLEKTKSAAGYIVRVSFGTALIASIVLVYTTIIALISSRSEDNDRGRRGRSYDSGFSFYLNPVDLFWYWDPYYNRRPRKRRDDGGMNFIESVFSFVFGDGDPNQGIEEERWKLIGEYISSNGGVVTAEELAPYLDVTKDPMNDESYVLPVLLRFGGQPEVNEEGNILYRFPTLQRTASSQRSGQKEYVGRKWSQWVGGVEKFFKENKWQFSKTSNAERAMVVGLGALNLFGVIILGTMLTNTAVRPSGFITFVSDIFPLLQIYAGSFFAIPIVRWFFIRNTNAIIENRNQAREQRAAALELPDISLRRKLLSARDMAQKSFIGQDQIIYSTEKDLLEQDYDAQEWDQKFKEIRSA